MTDLLERAFLIVPAQPAPQDASQPPTHSNGSAPAETLRTQHSASGRKRWRDAPPALRALREDILLEYLEIRATRPENLRPPDLRHRALLWLWCIYGNHPEPDWLRNDERVALYIWKAMRLAGQGSKRGIQWRTFWALMGEERIHWKHLDGDAATQYGLRDGCRRRDGRHALDDFWDVPK